MRTNLQSTLPGKRRSTALIHQTFNSLAILAFLLFASLKLSAEGSKELIANGGYRAYLNSTSNISTAAPFPTPGTMKVYVKAGETIYVGSSAQGVGNGTIILRTPNGTTYTSGTSTTVGKISNRNQEIAGPSPNTGGYTPYTRLVGAAEVGVWEIDFIAPNAASSTNPSAVLTTANWSQGTSFSISAFDVSVRNIANTAFLTGRVYTNIFCGNMGNFELGFNAIFKILTKDGYVYSVNNNGLAGFNFQFFVNNKGFKDTTGTPTYKSLNTASTTPPVYDPRSNDSSSTDITHKIFFNDPAADLPASAPSPSGTVWLKNSPITPTITSYSFTGGEGTSGIGGTNPIGGYINFNANQNGSYNIKIDINRDGDYLDAVDRTLTGSSTNGANSVFWDGLDGTGAKVPASTVSIPISVNSVLYGGEVHFPFFDVESNINGVIITRTTGSGAPNDIVYWNDSNITNTGTAPNPLSATNGISSSTNGHIWSNSFGNEKGMDTWAYVLSATISSTLTFTLRESDLEVVTLSTPSTALCTGQTVTYTTQVRNNGPSNITGASYKFVFPTNLSGVSVSNSVSGTASITSSSTTSTQYNATLSMNNGAVITYTITGTVASVPAGGNMAITSAVMRATDYTDPDATLPDAAAPSDAQLECDGAPSGVGCNNIKTSSLVVTLAPTTSNAGPDQTLCAATSATLAGNTATSGTGTWTVVSSTAGTPVFTTPSSPTTTVTGLTTGTYVFRWSITTGGACAASTDDVQIVVQGALANNVITAPATSTFCGSSDPAAISGSTPTGGSGSYVYQWQGSTDNVTFTNISGATSASYDPSTLSATTYYRRQITSGACSSANTSNTVTITIQPVLGNNTATGPATTTFCTSGDPANIVGSTPTGGSGTYAYQWQSSTDNVTFTNITAANSISYDPSSLSVTTYFRRQVTSGACSTPSNSNTITITVNPTLTAGVIGTNQNFCVSGNPAAFTEITAASGGSGSYTYKWQISTTSAVSGFSDISGATSSTYDAPVITQTSYYRRIVSSSVCTDATSNTITVTVNPLLTSGTVAASQSFCIAGDPAAFTETVAASGGDGSYSYQWQSSSDNITFTNISGATANVYDAPTVSSTTYFRRTVSSSVCTSVNSNVLTITVLNGLANNTIAADQTICTNTAPAALTGSTPTGGTGSYTYLWESSTTGSSGYAAASGTNTNIGYTPGTLTQTTTFRRMVSSGACLNAVSNIVTITVNPVPTTANAGADQGPLNGTFVTLDGNTPSVGTGTWTRISGPNTPTIQNPNQANTNVTGMIPGTYVFRWTIANSPCASSTDDVTIRINVAPVAANDATSTPEDTPKTFSITSNDADSDGSLDLSSIVIQSPVSHGTLLVNANGTVTYTPTANYNGSDVFTYTINDNLGTSSNTATVTITITAVNDAPDAQNDNVNTAEDVPLNIPAPGVLSNDIDVDGDALTVSLVTNVSHGTLTLNANGSYSYTPTLDYTGFDSFRYRACDGSGLCDTAIVTIEVGNVNDAPVANNNSYTVAEDNTLTVAAPGILANDTDADGDVLSATLLTNVTHGTLTLNNTGSFVYTPTANYNGTDSYTYKACDGSGACSNATVTITITPVNDQPVASPLSYSTNEDQTLNIPATGVLAGVTDIDGNPLTASVFTAPTHGTLTLNANGSFSYVPAADYNGVDQFVYRACDNGSPALCDTARVTITINPVNDAPVAVADAYTVAEDGTLTINNPGVLSNDSDKDNDPLTATLLVGPTHGTLTLNPNGRFVYVPAANYNGPDQFTYNACDAGSLCSSTTVSITVTAVNDGPTAGNDSYSVTEDNTLTVNAPGVISNDADIDGDALTVTLVSGTSNGTLTLNPNGSFTYVPNPDYNGSDQFTYSVCDPSGVCATGTVSLQINAANDKPIANDNSYTTNEDQTLTIAAPGPVANDSDPDGDPLTAARITLPLHGTVTVNADGSFVYVPAANYNGPDQFDYRVCDGNSSCDTATIFITINPVNDTPTAGSMSFSATEDQTLNVPAVGVLGNSSDIDGNTLSASVVSGPSHGTLTLNSNGSFSYTPASNYNGTDVFVVNVCDPFGACATATITINVAPVNDPPIVTNSNYTLNEDVNLTVANPGVLASVVDPDGDAMTVTVLTQPKHGTITLNPQGGFVYSPDADYNGTDSVQFQACDIYNSCTSGYAKFTINPVNDAPRTGPSTYTIDEDNILSRSAPGLLFNDYDPEGNAMSASLFTQALHGTVVVNSNGSFTYTPNLNYNGTDVFTYRNCDNAIPSLCSNQSVTIIINPVNDKPTAALDSYTTAEDNVLTVPAAGVLANDVDPEGNPITATLFANPTFGTVVLNANGSFVYTPTLDYTGTDQFIYESCDNSNACDTTIVTITITPVNDAPRPQDDNYSTPEDVPLTITAPGVLFNDSDPEGNPMTAAVVSNPLHGTVSIAPNGTMIYTPNADFLGIDSLTYSATDNFGATGTAIVRIVVTGVNDNPVAINDTVTVAEDNTLNVAAAGVLGNDSDIDGDVITVQSVVTPPTHGTVTLNANGGYSYTPNLNYNGTDSYTYSITDGNGGTATALVYIIVTSVNDDPQPQGISYTINEDTPLSPAAPGLLFNDVDPDGDVLTASLNSPASNGVVVVNPNGSFTYTPNLNFVGTDSFTYLETDGNGGSAVATVTIIVRPINDVPVAVDDNYTVAEDNVLNIASSGILGNDSDVDGDALSVANVIVQPTNGSLSFNSNGSFAYTPNLNFNGTDNFTYVLSDGNGGTDTAVVTITVTPVNDDPVARNDDFSVATNTTLNVPAPGVIFNDSEFDGETLTVTLISSQVGTSGGILTINSDGSLSYIPFTNLSYDETFNYTVNDQTGHSATATATFHVGAGNDSPVAANDTYSTAEDQVLTVPARGVLVNDVDPDDAIGMSNLAAVLVTSPLHGTLTLNPDGSFTYTPNQDYFGNDSFTYNATDANGSTDDATVQITITSVNDAPVASDDNATTPEDVALNITIASNDNDVDGTLNLNSVDLDPSTVTEDKVLTISGEGTYTVNGSGVVNFVPVTNYNGSATPIRYTIKDNNGALSNQAVIAVIVTAVNDAPFANPDSYSLSEDGVLTVPIASGVLINDGDVDGDPIVSVLSTTSNGSLTLNSDGSFTYQPNPNFNGTDSFTYRACDASGACSAPVQVTFTVNAVNDAPVAVNDSLTIVEDTPGSGSVTANDSDVDGNPLSYGLVSQPSFGTVVFNTNGTYTYTPGAYYNGSDQFSYQVCDNGGLCATAFVILTVTPVNNSPQANPESYTLQEDVELDVNQIDGVLRNDIDPDGELIISTLVSTSNGTLVLNPNGSFRYIPNPNFYGTDSFVYQACDSSNACSQATVTLNITPVNDKPIAVDDAFTIPEDYTLSRPSFYFLLPNDFDADGDSMYVSPVGSFTKGTLIINPNGSFTYTSAPNFNGLDSIQYQICDLGGLCDTAFVRLTITPVNDAPTVNGETYNVGEDSPLSIDAPGLLANDSDVDGDALMVALVTGPKHGTVSVTAQGAIVYNPATDFNGLDSIVYQVCDPSMACIQAVVYFNVTAGNDAPTAGADTYTMTEDGVLNQSAPGVLFNDFDKDGDAITASLVTSPSNGTLVFNPNGSFVYTPNANYNGVDQFVYKVCDNASPSACVNQTVTITVNAANDAPKAVADVLTANEDQTLTIVPPGLLANDVDVDGDPLTASVYSPPLHGTLTLNPNGSFTYVPSPNYNGTDRFVYQVCDNTGACDTASVTFNVQSVNDNPVAVKDLYTTTEDNVLTIPASGVLFNDSDVDGDPLSVVILSGPDHGLATLSPNGALSYTPNADYNGLDTIRYTVSDGNGGTATGLIVITVSTVNDNPVGTNDFYSTNEDAVLNVPVTGVLANDSDVDGDALTASSVVSLPSNGTVTQNPNGSFSYTPNANFKGTDSYDYLLSDGKGGTDTVTVFITVNSVNDAPVANSDSYNVTEDTPLSIPASGVLFNDVDVDGDALSASLFTQPLHGTLTLSSNGSFTYVPDGNYTGTDVFTYVVSDGLGGTSTATVTLNVTPVNDAPSGVADTYSVNEDATLTIAAPGVLSNDIDVDGDVLSVGQVTTDPAHGVLTQNSNGSFTYVPNPNYNGPDSYVYTILDGHGGTSSALVTINVVPVNDPPIARNDQFIVETNVTLVIGAPGVLFNDAENDGEALTVTIKNGVVGSNGGTLSLDANGSLTYVPAPGLSYTETFPYTVSDASGNSASAIITFVVGAGNDAPVAVNDNYTTTEEVTLTVPAKGVLNNDSDPDDAVGQNNLAAILVTGPTKGTLNLNGDGSFTYVPDHNAFGTDNFTYNATDANGATALATVTITINAVNDAPVAADDTVSTTEDTAVNLNLIVNDSDIDGTVDGSTIDLNPATVTEDKTFTVVGEGTYTVSNTGVLTFTPAANFQGVTSPRPYTVKDNNGLVSNTATITITVISVNDAPVAVGDAYTVAEDGFLTRNASNGVLINDSDPDGEALVSVLMSTSNGTLVLNSNGSFTYHPNANFFGTDAFTYKACDVNGACSAPTTVTINVTPVNDAPIAVNDTVSTAENTLVNGNASLNDSDIEGNPLNYAVSVGPANGTLVMNTNGTFNYTPNANFNGQDRFTYRVCDNGPACATAFVYINVSSVNQPPVANADLYTISEDQQLNRTAATGVLINDVDPDGDMQTTLITTTTNGTLAFNTDGSFLYTPNASFNGNDQFIYQACDIFGACDTALVRIRILSVNDAPIARDDFFNIPEDTVIVYDPLVYIVNSNDTDPDGDPLNIEFIGNLTHGTNIDNGDGTYTYFPAPNFNGVDSIQYRICDPSGLCDTAYIKLNIIPRNDTPVANPDMYSVAEDGLLTVNAPGVLGNDSDADNDIIVSTLVTTTNGTLTLNPDGSFTYEPNPGFVGSDNFTYSACDINGACDTTNVIITVNSVNDAPVAINDTLSTFNDTPVTGNVLTNDTDPEGDLLVAAKVSDPAHGTVVVNPDGTFTYSPAAGYFGADQFLYKVCDNGIPSQCDTALVYINVIYNFVNVAPIAVNDNYTILTGNTLTVAAPGVITNDVDADKQLLVATLLNDVTKGVLAFNSDGSFTYTPNSGFIGQDSFRYQICDTAGLCDTATAYINVTAPNRAPIAVNDNYTTQQNTTLNIAAPGILGNDSEPDGDPLTVTILTQPGHGTLVLTGPAGSFRYIPAANYSGQDSFMYRICDNKIPKLCSTATVYIQVNATNKAPKAVRDFYTVAKDGTISVNAPGIMVNDSDPNSDPITPTLLGTPLHGSMTLNPDGSFTYTPTTGYVGLDSVLYKVCDPAGLCAQAYVVFNVVDNSTNNPPAAQNDSIVLDEDTQITFPRAQLTANDNDPEGDALIFTIMTQPAHGTLIDNGDGTYTYKPDPNYNGPDSFTYRVCDSKGLCATATVFIRVIPVNDKPVAVDDNFTTPKNTTITLPAPGILSNDSDIDGDILSSALIGNTLHGTITVSANGAMTYIPNQDYVGADSVPYVACDGGGLCDTAMILINISPSTNRPPNANDDFYTTPVNTTLTVAAPGVLSNDSDPDGDPLTATKVTETSNGTITQNSNGSLVYNPNTNFVGVDTYTYNSCDNGNPSLCVTKLVTITVVGNASIGLAKEASVPAAQPDGSYLVTYTMRVRNYGSIPVTNVQITDNLSGTFPSPVTFSIAGSPSGTGNLNGNSSFNGSSDINMLDGTGTLAAGEQQSVSVVVRFNLNGATGPFNNSATATGKAGSQDVSDVSTSGTDPDPDGNGNPSDNNSATPITITQSTRIGIAKAVSAPRRELDGSYTFTYTFVVKNYGTTVLQNISVFDDLTQAFPQPSVFKIKEAVTATGGLRANPDYTGRGANDLLTMASALGVGRADTIYLTINVLPDENVTVYNNSAMAAGRNGAQQTTDNSNSGLNPDGNGNGLPDENIPTPVTLKTDGIFIPGGFSPDGDGINDVFFVENTKGQTIDLEMYNRWGNIVFKDSNYQNNWGGKCNNGIYVGDDVPDGTYYYVIKLSGGDGYVGFITINR